MLIVNCSATGLPLNVYIHTWPSTLQPLQLWIIHYALTFLLDLSKYAKKVQKPEDKAEFHETLSEL